MLIYANPWRKPFLTTKYFLKPGVHLQKSSTCRVATPGNYEANKKDARVKKDERWSEVVKALKAGSCTREVK